jgi:hypothetical protein
MVHAIVKAAPDKPRSRPYGTHESAQNKTPNRSFTTRPLELSGDGVQAVVGAAMPTASSA